MKAVEKFNEFDAIKRFEEFKDIDLPVKMKLIMVTLYHYLL